MQDVHELRQDLHRHPELSCRESGTAQRILRFFEPLNPDGTLTGLGGHGLAFIFQGPGQGPTVLFRCELDALPIQEAPSHLQSETPGVSHQCGHDGHMAILAALGRHLSQHRPHRGRAVLLFQPAEETGAGAKAVIADPRFHEITPDYAFALHNLPGYPLGQVVLKDGPFACASRGIAITLEGSTAHAAQPETGRSPARAMSRLVNHIDHLPQDLAAPGEIAFGTVVGARMGEKAFGTAPGKAEVWATVRSETDGTMQRLTDHVEALARDLATEDSLTCTIRYEDVFAATTNHPEAVEIIRRAAPDSLHMLEQPFRFSEDFGEFTSLCPGALFGLGIGEDAPGLHSPAYRFPDEAIPMGTKIFDRCVGALLGNSP